MLNLDQDVDLRFLAIARIGVGLTATFNLLQAWSVLTSVAKGSLAFPSLGWLPAVTETRGAVLLAVGLVAAVALTFGAVVRVSGVTVTVVIWAMFLWDQQTYSNHLMLTAWLTLWLAWSKCSAAWSVGPARGRATRVRMRDQLPLMTQLSVCYLFAAISKLNDGFLSGAELRNHADVHLPDQLLRIAAVGTVALELSLAILLWLPRIQPPVLTLGIAMHVSIPLTMWSNAASLVSFSITCLCLYPLFLGLRVRRGNDRTPTGSATTGAEAMAPPSTT